MRHTGSAPSHSRPRRRGRALVTGLALLLTWVIGPQPSTAQEATVQSSPPIFRATGFFHTERRGKRWWLVTPDGRPFYANGIDHVTPSPDVDRATGRCPYCDAIAARYADLDEWAAATVARLQGWGFNTLGAWSDVDRLAPMPYTVLLDMAGGDDWFAPEFEARCAAIAAGEVARRRDDPNLVGWYTDSELR